MRDKNTILTEQFIRIANKWKAVDARPIEVAEGFFVTPSEIHFIDVIWRNKNINVTELAKILGITKGAISQMVAILSKKEILIKARDGNNKKTALLILTEKGEMAAKFHERLHETLNTKIASIFNEFSEDTVDKANEMMERLEAFFDELYNK